MGREKSVPGKVCKIISCIKKSGYQRNYAKEADVEDRFKREHRDGWVSMHDMKTDPEYEYLLLKESKWDDKVEKDFWTGEAYISSYQFWYRYKLVVQYSYKNCTYEKEIEQEWHSKQLEENQTIYLSFDEDDPEKILSISNISENNDVLLYIVGILIVCFCFLLVLLIYLAL